MNLVYLLNSDRTFDRQEELHHKDTPFWTADSPPQPMWSPVYTGGLVNAETGEVSGGAWSDPGAPAAKTALELLVEAKLRAYKRNNDAYDEATMLVTKGYPQSEKDTWPTQDREMKAYQVDPANALTPWIDTAASFRGITRELYISKTLAKIQQFEQVSAYLTGKRQGYEDAIKAALLPAVIDAMVFNYPLPS